MWLEKRSEPCHGITPIIHLFFSMKALGRILNSKGMIKTRAPDFLLLSSPSQLFHLHPGSFSMSSLGRGETSLTWFWVLSTYKWQAAKLEMESLNSAFNRSEEISAVGNSFYFSTKTGFQDDHFSRKQNWKPVQSLSQVRLFVTPWTAAHQVSLSITNSQSLLNLHAHHVSDAIQPSFPLSHPCPPAFSLSHHEGLFQ